MNRQSKPDMPAMGYIINEQGEEVPITEEMVSKSMADAKLQSIGAHTGYTKVVTDEMIEDYKQKHPR